MASCGGCGAAVPEENRVLHELRCRGGSIPPPVDAPPTVPSVMMNDGPEPDDVLSPSLPSPTSLPPRAADPTRRMRLQAPSDDFPAEQHQHNDVTQQALQGALAGGFLSHMTGGRAMTGAVAGGAIGALMGNLQAQMQGIQDHMRLQHQAMATTMQMQVDGGEFDGGFADNDDDDAALARRLQAEEYRHVSSRGALSPPFRGGRRVIQFQFQNGGAVPSVRQIFVRNLVQHRHGTTNNEEVPEHIFAMLANGAPPRPRAEQDEIDRLPAHDYAPTTSGADDEQTSCSVCLEQFAIGESLRTLPCGHFYHCACIDKWLVECSRQCPLCNREV